MEQVESLNPAYKFLSLQSTHGEDVNAVSFIYNGLRHYETVAESNLNVQRINLSLSKLWGFKPKKSWHMSIFIIYSKITGFY